MIDKPLKTFAELKPTGAITRDHQTTQPVHLKMLVELHGATKAASILGLTPGTLSYDIRNNETRVVTELAAKGVLQEETTVRPKKQIGELIRDIRSHYEQFTIFSLPPLENEILGKTLRELLTGGR